MESPQEFKERCAEEIAAMGRDEGFERSSQEWMQRAELHRYTYHFEWLGRPIIQFPQDILAMQELIWTVRPEVIVETGIAHGGSLVFYASMLELLVQCGMIQHGRVIGVDIDIRTHNRQAIEAHPLARRITMVQGSSVAPDTVAAVRALAGRNGPCLLALDSNHTHGHVLAELRAYADLVTVGSYCVVFDTAIEHSPNPVQGRGWGKGNNPLTAVDEFLAGDERFAQDSSITDKLRISECPGGYLKRVR
ncbi:cephalosporin hydroxylase family protein [Fundidesulfovibrio soli]|uniref:cephalosporin hydroxylase family protein n=1 Tax=Fundidesulfovibrio soli TaxID=2922716 RepID=UPI001FAEE6AA|nr:cephalosporin hydroxylase family protein [Fundidesulfovibrio soli]